MSDSTHPRHRFKQRSPAATGSTGFQATGLHFPTEGCWRVTGKAGNASLTFVTIVITTKTLGLVTS